MYLVRLLRIGVGMNYENDLIDRPFFLAPSIAAFHTEFILDRACGILFNGETSQGCLKSYYDPFPSRYAMLRPTMLQLTSCVYVYIHR